MLLWFLQSLVLSASLVWPAKNAILPLDTEVTSSVSTAIGTVDDEHLSWWDVT
jgi:hypothetical protein